MSSAPVNLQLFTGDGGIPGTTLEGTFFAASFTTLL
jgi:hypothetical protein